MVNYISATPKKGDAFYFSFYSPDKSGNAKKIIILKKLFKNLTCTKITQELLCLFIRFYWNKQKPIWDLLLLFIETKNKEVEWPYHTNYIYFKYLVFYIFGKCLQI